MLSITLAMTLSTASAQGAQAAIPSAPPAPSVAAAPRRGVPGDRAGTERWLVTFESRSFDLGAFREANFGGASADEIDRIVAGLEDAVRADQEEFVEFVEKLGGRVTAQWWLINGCAIEVPGDKVAAVRGHERVQRMDPEEIVGPVGVMPIKVATNSKNHNADSVHNLGFKGKGVTVAIMDTGLDHPMGSSGRPHRSMYVNGDVNNKTGGGIGGSRLLIHKTFGRAGPDDVHNHGTGVMGIAAGEVWSNAAGDRGHAPLSGLGNYCIADSASGGAQFQNIINAWQAIAADAVRHKIVAANNSYTGSPDPTHASQQALDSAALNANVLPVCAAGNSSSSTSRSQSVANGLAVAAVTGATGSATDKRMASFSSRGPLSGDSQRFYPDISANGVNTQMPQRNNESGIYRASGTSMASPQVCGAAAIYRAIRTADDTLQTKAALLATTEDISKQNSRPPYNTRNPYGLGYLRDDRLLNLALGGGTITSGTVNSTSQPATFTAPVKKGKGYSIVVTWNRLDVTKRSWSNLDIEVKLGNQSLGTSATPRNLYERVKIVAPADGRITVLVSAKSLEKASVKFGAVVAEIPPPFIEGDVTAYGIGCLGTGKQVGVETVLPTALKTAFGKTYSELGLGYDNHRFQQVFNSTAVPGSFQARIIAFRFEDLSFPGALRNYWSELEIDLGYSPNAPDKLSPTFASNITGTPTRVLARKRVNLPDYTARNASPANFAIKIPLDRPFVHQAQAGRYLMIDIKKTDSSLGNRIVNYFLDATSDASKMWASRVYGRTPTATTGAVATGLGTIIGFNAAATGAVPQLTNSGAPEIGGTYKLEVAQAVANARALLFVGASDQRWGTFTLPLSLRPFGGQACSLFASAELQLPLQVDAQGKASLTLSVPANKSLIQANIFHQAAIVDPRANTLGLAFTNALRALIGGQP